MAFTDIRFDLIQQLPLRWQPYAMMMRLDRPIGWWLLLLPCWWAIALAGGGIARMEARDWYLIGLFFVGAIVMRGAGCVINDLWDRDLDSKVLRTRVRPLAAGIISVKRAFMFLCVLLLMGLGVLLQLPALSVIIGCLSMILVVVYPLMKRVTWWPQAFLGITFNIGALIAWAAVTQNISLTPVLLYAAGFFWTLGYDTIYAHQDKEDDTLAGIKSTALLFGEYSRTWVAGFYILTMTFLCAAVLSLSNDIGNLIWLIPAGAHLVWQVMRWNPADPYSSLAIFKANRIAGLLVFGGFLLA